MRWTVFAYSADRFLSMKVLEESHYLQRKLTQHIQMYSESFLVGTIWVSLCSISTMIHYLFAISLWMCFHATSKCCGYLSLTKIWDHCRDHILQFMIA